MLLFSGSTHGVASLLTLVDSPSGITLAGLQAITFVETVFDLGRSNVGYHNVQDHAESCTRICVDNEKLFNY